MGYLDSIVDGNFKTTEDGTQLYYPYGYWGKGYILPDVEKKEEIRKTLKILFSIMLFPSIIWFSFFFPSAIFNRVSWWLVILPPVVLIGGVGWYTFHVRNTWLKGLSGFSEKLTLEESLKNSAKSLSVVNLWAGVTFGIFVVLSNAAMIRIMIANLGADLFKPDSYFTTFLFILFCFGIPLGVYLVLFNGYMIRLKRRG